jgi:predicted dehydrogenase
MLNLALVGLGFMAATHIKALRQVPGARVAALCNPSGRHLDGDFTGVAGNVGDNAPVKLEPGSFKAFRDFTALLSDPDIHAVDICAPTLAHRDLAIAALRAGKHVLCEKPLARTAAQAREMAAVAAETGRILMPAMCLRFFPEWVWVRAAIADGHFGKVLSARFRRVAEPPGWGQQNFLDGAKSGGALLDLHIHDTDFVQFCFGRPRAVRSTGYTKLSGAIDHVVTEYEVGGGAMVHAEGAWCFTPGFGFNMSYTVNFERATVDYDLARGADALKLCEAGQPAQTLKLGQPDGYVGELRHFVECCTAGTLPTVVTATDGVSAMEICEAEERSILSSQRIALA